MLVTVVCVPRPCVFVPGTPAGAGAASTPPAEDTEDPAALVREHGPQIYELYAVLLHSGGALGGHYYAYIKDMSTGKWFNFNDSSVTPISVSELKSAYGGSSSYGGAGVYQSSANAYMLLYRYVSLAVGCHVMSCHALSRLLASECLAVC